jgi:hypothetical protein
MKPYYILFLFFLVRCGEEHREVSYYPNGTLKYTVPLIEEKREGLGYDYFESGKIKAVSKWENGVLDGESIVYFENGNIFQKSYFENGIQRDTGKIYDEAGWLKQVAIFDSLGRMEDYFVFKKEGTRNFNHETKQPIFLDQSDTLYLGENYIAQIRLGNRQFNFVDVFIGDINDRDIMKKNPPLPKKDSITSILKIKSDSLGRRKLEGVILERNKKMDSLDVIPFTHYFYVKPKSN